MAFGNHIDKSATAPVQLRDGEIEMVEDFTYHGDNIIRDGEINKEVKHCNAKVARAFSCLQRSVFKNQHLSVETNKGNVYKATVLSVLLCGAETWTVKAESVRQLSGFHNRFIRSMLGVTKYQLWKE